MRMKNILFFLFFIGTIHSSYSQSVGLFVGMNNAKLSGDTPNEARYKSLLGLNVGALVDIPLTESTTLSIQPSYSQGGTRVEYQVPGVLEPVDSIKIRTNYFSLPVLLKISATNKRFYAIGGIEYSMLLNSALSSHGKEEDVDLGLSSWNLSVHFGAGYRVPIGITNLFFEIKYIQGLVNLTDKPLEKSYIPRVKSSGIIINGGIEIPLNNLF